MHRKSAVGSKTSCLGPETAHFASAFAPILAKWRYSGALPLSLFLSLCLWVVALSLLTLFNSFALVHSFSVFPFFSFVASKAPSVLWSGQCWLASIHWKLAHVRFAVDWDYLQPSEKLHALRIRHLSYVRFHLYFCKELMGRTMEYSNAEMRELTSWVDSGSWWKDKQ